MKKFDFYGSTAVFLVTDIMSTVDYYTHKIGFELDSTFGDPPYHAQVSIGRLEGNSALEGYIPVTIQFLYREKPSSSENYLYLRVGYHMHELYELYRSRNVNITSKIEDKPWGMTEFRVLDPNGYTLVFGGHTEDQKQRT